MKYKIEWCEVKKEGETNGRAWKITNMTLKDETGQTIDEVSTFDAVMPGQEIEGFIETKGQYKNFKKSLEKPNFMKKEGFSANKAKEVIDYKDEKIGKNADNKDHSIRISSTMNKAIDLAIADGNMEQKLREETILYWREWIWKHWDDPDTNPIYPN